MIPPHTSGTKREKAVRIVNHLISSGYTAYLVGGCVRDALLGLDCPDYDIATSARPEEVQKLFSRTIAVGAHFGVVLVMDGQDSFEVATYRADDQYIDGRRPASVRYVSVQEDVERRDFTINGLLYDVNKNETIDFVNGIADLKSGIIRTIGNPVNRFTEDKLRLLRAIRFAARLSFTIEEETWSALKKLAPEITKVSHERTRDEIEKMLLGKNTHVALDLLYSSGLLQIVLPEVARMKGVEQPPEFHPEGDVWQHTILMFKLLENDTTKQKTKELVWSVLLHDVGKPDTFRFHKDRIRFNNHNTVGKIIAEKILKRLKAPNDLLNTVSTAVDNHMAFMNVPNMRINTLKRFIRRPTFPMELELHKLDCASSHRDMKITDILVAKQDELSKEKISPPQLVSGKDLLEMGFEPGPIFKKILNEVEDQQLLDIIHTKEEALIFVRKNFL